MLQRLQDRSIVRPHRLGRQWPSNSEHWRRHDLRCCSDCKQADKQGMIKGSRGGEGSKRGGGSSGRYCIDCELRVPRGSGNSATCTRVRGIEGWRDATTKMKPKSETLAVAPRSSKAHTNTLEGQGQGRKGREVAANEAAAEWRKAEQKQRRPGSAQRNFSGSCHGSRWRQKGTSKKHRAFAQDGDLMQRRPASRLRARSGSLSGDARPSMTRCGEVEAPSTLIFDASAIGLTKN